MSFLKSNPKKRIHPIAVIVQNGVTQKLIALGKSPESFSSLDQAGLTDGLHIIEEFLEHGEWGLAVEHIQYMVEETNVYLNDNTKETYDDLVKEYSSSKRA